MTVATQAVRVAVAAAAVEIAAAVQVVGGGA